MGLTDEEIILLSEAATKFSALCYQHNVPPGSRFNNVAYCASELADNSFKRGRKHQKDRTLAKMAKLMEDI